jgi:hypothetical protein
MNTVTRKTMTTVLIGMCLALLLSCSWSDRRLQEASQMPPIPVSFQTHFSACAPLDGAVFLSVQSESVKFEKMEFIWNSVSSNQFIFQISSPVGDPMVSGKRVGSVIEAQGVYRPEIQISPDGWVVVNGYELPIADYEVSCFLGGVWPVSWMRSYLTLTKEANDGSKLIFDGRDSKRDIHLEMESLRHSSGHSVSSCTVLRWGGFFGILKSSAEICMTSTQGKYQVRITGVPNTQIDWESDHGS